jgi:hypothetical protein
MMAIDSKLSTTTLFGSSSYSVSLGKRKHSIYFSSRLKIPDNVWRLKGLDIPFANNVTYLGVTFDRRMSWRQSYPKYCIQGLVHLRKDLFTIQKWAFKYKYWTYALQRSD